MKIGIISDTHDHLRRLQRAIELLNEAGVDLVVHCGDWIAPFSLTYYHALQCGVKGVLGNNDGEVYRLMAKCHDMQGKIEIEKHLLEFDMDGQSFGVFHGDPERITRMIAESGRYDVLLTGHTHIPEIREVGTTLHINPGSVAINWDEHGIAAQTSFALYDTETREARLLYFEAPC